MTDTDDIATRLQLAFAYSSGLFLAAIEDGDREAAAQYATGSARVRLGPGHEVDRALLDAFASMTVDEVGVWIRTGELPEPLPFAEYVAPRPSRCPRWPRDRQEGWTLAARDATGPPPADTAGFRGAALGGADVPIDDLDTLDPEE